MNREQVIAKLIELTNTATPDGLLQAFKEMAPGGMAEQLDGPQECAGALKMLDWIENELKA